MLRRLGMNWPWRGSEKLAWRQPCWLNISVCLPGDVWMNTDSSSTGCQRPTNMQKQISAPSMNTFRCQRHGNRTTVTSSGLSARALITRPVFCGSDTTTSVSWKNIQSTQCNHLSWKSFLSSKSAYQNYFWRITRHKTGVMMLKIQLWSAINDILQIHQ